MEIWVRGRSGAWIAWATLAVYWGCVGAGFLLRVLNDSDFAVWDQLFERVTWGACPTVGAVIVAHQPRNRIGWLCCTVGLLVGPAFFAHDYAWYALVHPPGSLPGGLAMAWLSQWPSVVAYGLVVTFLLLLFPDGRLVSPRWRIVAWGGRRRPCWLVGLDCVCARAAWCGRTGDGAQPAGHPVAGTTPKAARSHRTPGL